MTDKADINPRKEYTVGETAELVGLSDRHVARLVDLGEFPGAGRKSPLPGSHRTIPGSAIIAYIENKK